MQELKLEFMQVVKQEPHNMNNSKIALDNEDVFQEKDRDNTPMLTFLRKKEGELVKIIEAIERVAHTSDWKVLRESVFDGLTDSLEKRLQAEANKSQIVESEVYRLQGQLVWARKFADFKKLADAYRSELSNVKQKLSNNLGTEPFIAPDTYEND